ncbi:hypothetical protein M422DRAFT_50419 [Sphaerobolus stellatus SS14]|uniref:Unplaced genomic scaffold SPHSTscaffold_94, whole genome shotgun sequence n=1 Tax=Sphaerobolus stellatus (strain SS14) TaxID=990650 RepID=A0A0C9VJ58_SPHS4|nr:hypothetical protein M422DRAFT_50419 [Sphaerobolus stellatus SS14]
MTPPMEESTPSSSESEQNQQAFRAMQSLRKILDDSADPKGKRPESPQKPPKTFFLPRSPSVAPSSGTSMATASVFRLFTKNSHHPSSARPKQSSLKKLAPPDTPTSQRSSAPSTPRTVSFAELPPDFPGRTSSWRDKDKGRRSKGKGKASKEPETEETKWWKWLSSPTVLHPNTGAYEERIEDKMMRGWARPGTGSSAGDDWMM